MSGDTRLSVIAEDGDVQPAPPIPLRAAHRPFGKRFHHGDPPRHSFEKPPPPYSVWSDVTGPKGERLGDLRRNRFIAKRGGWRRLCIIGFVVIAVLVGLIVGLVVGLRRKRSNEYVIPQQSTLPILWKPVVDNRLPSSSVPPSTPSSGTAPTGPFPVGAYALTPFLDTVSTNCTSNEATWRCYPYTTYKESPTRSMATFNWIITAADQESSSTDFVISSTDNPFALDFTNVSMRLVDAGLSSERYTFSVTTNKTVIPSAAITRDNTLATCFYNGTTFRAELYTKMSKVYQSAASPSTTPDLGNSTGERFQLWPYAIRVEESIGGGDNVPACYRTTDGNLGERITDGLSAQPSGDKCSCLYKDFNT